MFNSLVGNALSSVQRYDNIVCALAGYWYAATPDKQDSFPIVNPYPQGVLPDSTKTLADFDSFDDWYSSFTMPLFGTQGQWKVTRYSDGEMIHEFSPDLELVFSDWYDYFNDQGSGGGGTPPDQPTVDENGNYFKFSNPNGTGAFYILQTDTVSASTVLDGKTFNFGNSAVQFYNADVTNRKLINSNTAYSWGVDCATIYVYYRASDFFSAIRLGPSDEQFTYTRENGNTFQSTLVTQSDEVPITAYYGERGTAPGVVNQLVVTNCSQFYFNNTLYTFNNSSADDEPVYPSRPGVEDPEVPTAPTLPSLPDINFPDVGITTGNDNTATTTDLQPILDALRIINDNLIATYDQMEGFDNWVFDAYSSLLTTLQNQTQYIGQWMDGLSKQLDSESKLILKELRKISYYLYQLLNKKTSGGGPSIDPVAQDDEVWNWWDAVLRKLLSLLPTAVVEFLQQLQRLNSVFPFSIPWDIGFMLGLFTQPAQTPVFDIAINSAYFRWSAHVDLSQWNALATLIRRGELLAFAMTLAMYTPAALEQLKVI